MSCKPPAVFRFRLRFPCCRVKPVHAVSGLLAALLLGGCVAKPTPSSVPSFDGLIKVVDTRYSQIWIRPGINLSDYRLILPLHAPTQYKLPDISNAWIGGSKRQSFPLDERSRARFEEMVQDSFSGALKRSEQIQLATSPGPDTLIVETGLMGLAPDQPMQKIGREQAYLSAVASSTLKIEIRDSETNAVLVRELQRQVSRPLGIIKPAGPIADSPEVRKALQTWSTLLLERLEELILLPQLEEGARNSLR